LTDAPFQLVDLLSAEFVGSLSGEDRGGAFEELLSPTDDDGIGELMLATEDGQGLLPLRAASAILALNSGVNLRGLPMNRLQRVK
jgi:hypothetical protein